MRRERAFRTSRRRGGAGDDTGEGTTLSPQELNDEESTGEFPEKEPVRQDNEATAR